MSNESSDQATQFRGARTPNRSLHANPENPVPTTTANEEIAVAVVTSSNGTSSKKSWVGKQLDEYVVEKWLGGGGMGQVYLAKHRWLDIPVAIKVMNPAHGDDPEAVDRFRREAKMAATLDHPNIVKATDGGSADGCLYLVTEYIEGNDLKAVVDQAGAVESQHACWMIMEVAQALQHAHQMQMIHRDIKPSNIMLLKDGSVKVLDLGLARYTNSQTQMTSTGQFMGTVDYVAPEQAIDTRNVDHRADIYSLGCTFYFLLTGRAPFDGEAYDTVISKILAHTEEDPLEVTHFANGIPKQVVAILKKMMAKLPEERFQSAGEVAEALSKFAKPLCGERRALVTNDTSVATTSSSEFSGACSKVATKCGAGLLTAIWLIFRTMLSMIGLIERVEISTNSRMSGKKQYKWQLSLKGVAVGTMIVFAIVYLYMSGFGLQTVEVEF